MQTKAIPFLLTLLAAGFSSHAQQSRPLPYYADTTSIAYDLRNTFSTLDASRLTTGILMDRVPIASNPHNYDGSTSKEINSYANWQQQYWEYYQAASSQVPTLTPAALRDKVTERVNARQIPLLMLSYRYDELVPDAAAKGLIRIDSVKERVYDGPTTSSPYQQRDLFAVSFATPLPSSGPVTIYIGSEFWLGSTPAPATLLIDFGDGYGQRQVAMNSTVEIRSNETPPTKPMLDQITKAVITQETISLQNLLSVINPQNGLQAFARLSTTTTLAVLPDMVLGLKASHTWNGYAAASALGWVKWGNGNATGKFRKPLVFVEGIDFGCDGVKDACSIFTPSQTGVITNQVLPLAAFTGTYRNGTAGWNEMVAYNSDFAAVEKLPALRDQLTQQGYDIIYLDFSDGATHIQSNAMTLVELLDYINNPVNRTTDATETIVTAASMGGQVARFALTWMEQQSLCHNSKLYVSIDSPHRGANIPLGLQYMIDRMSDVWIGGGKFGLKRDALMRPAAQQMMLYHFSSDAINPRALWQNWQASPNSYPTLLRKVAIANGNRLGQALPGAFPGMELLRTARVTPWWGEVYANSMPGAASRGNNNVIFRYRKPFSLTGKWHYTQVASSSPTIDQAPGGTRTTTADAQREAYGLLKSGSDYQTFIPAVSALDVVGAGAIGQSNLYYNIDGNIPDPSRPNPARYAFEAYYAPSGISEPHINITNGQASQQGNPSYSSDNTSWLLNELRESAHNLPPVLNASTAAYNYGSLYRRLLPSVQVAAGGQLFINNVNLPNSGGANTAATAKEASFEVYTSSCGSIVQLGQGGQLTLGQPSDPHVATLRIANKSLLDLSSGSQTVVNAGSVLRIQRGGTLVIRGGATLQLNGTLVVEDGAFICVENPAAIVTGSGGLVTVSANAYRYANPALGLSGLACQNYPACQATLSLDVHSDTSVSAKTEESDNAKVIVNLPTENLNDCTRLYTVTAVGTGLGTNFSWTVDGAAYSSMPNRPNSVHLVMAAGRPRNVSVQVGNNCDSRILTSATTVEGDFPNCTTSVVTIYPNPATNAVTFSEYLSDKAPTAPAQPSASRPQLRALATPEVSSFQVSLYDSQGALRWHATGTGQLELNSTHLPRGIYGVVITKNGLITRRTLSLQ